MERAIEAKKMVKTYGEGRTKVEALKAMDLAVNKGELLAIIILWGQVWILTHRGGHVHFQT